MMIPKFGYFSRLLTHEDNTPGPSSPFVSSIVRTISVEATFTEQHSNIVGPNCPIIQSLIITSPMVISSMVISSMLGVAVSVGYDTQMGDDDWVSTGINSDNSGFESNENEAMKNGLMRTVTIMKMKMVMKIISPIL